MKYYIAKKHLTMPCEQALGGTFKSLESAKARAIKELKASTTDITLLVSVGKTRLSAEDIETISN